MQVGNLGPQTNNLENAHQRLYNRKTVESVKEAVEQLNLSPTNLFFKPHVKPEVDGLNAMRMGLSKACRLAEIP
jgi:PleD family two-component response regulator